MKKHILLLLAVAGIAVAASIDQKVKAVAGSDNPSVDSVQSVSSYALTDKNGITKANTGTHDMTALVENTDYFVHRESGNDFLVTITNQSARAAFALVMHK